MHYQGLVLMSQLGFSRQISFYHSKSHCPKIYAVCWCVKLIAIRVYWDKKNIENFLFWITHQIILQSHYVKGIQFHLFRFRIVIQKRGHYKISGITFYSNESAFCVSIPSWWLSFIANKNRHASSYIARLKCI